jgi:hypothetical protein
VNPNVLTAAISAGAVTAIVALVVNAREFTLLDKRIDDLRADTNRRLTTIESDLKEFFRVQADHDKRIQRLEDKQ